MAATKIRRRATAAHSLESERTGKPGTRASMPSPIDPRRRREALKFFTIHEVAEMLGVCAPTVRRWIDSGELVSHRQPRHKQEGDRASSTGRPTSNHVGKTDRVRAQST